MKKYIIGFIIGVMATFGGLYGYEEYQISLHEKLIKQLDVDERKAILAKKFRNYQPAEKLFLGLLEKATAINDSYLIFFYNYNLAEIYWDGLVNPVKAHQHFIEAGKTIAAGNRTKEAMDYYRDYAAFLRGKGENEESIEMLKKAAVIAETLRDNDALFGAYEFIGSNYASIKDKDKSLEYFKKAGEFLDSGKNNFDRKYWYNKALLLNNKAYSLSELGKSKEAEPLATESIDILASGRAGETTLILNVYDTLGEIQYKIGKYKEAEENIRKAIIGFEKTSDGASSEVEVNYGNVLNKLNKVAEACKYWKKATEGYSKAGNDGELRLISRLITENSCK